MKKNVLRRNSGFIIGCLLAAGASYFTADAVMTRDLLSALVTPDTAPDESETLQPGETNEAETLAPETEQDRVFETDPFTVTASGNIIKGAESEAPQQTQTENGQTDENAEGDSAEADGEIGSDGEGNSGDDGSTGDGSYDDGDYSDDGSYNDGSYSGDDSYNDGSYSDDGYYDDGSYSDNGSSGDGSYSDGGSYGDSYSDSGSYGQVVEIQDSGNGSYTYDDGGNGGNVSDNSSAWTPSDVIIQGISSRYIDESELYDYDLGQLRLIRNEIFALHGRIFESQDLMDYFSQKSWYVPTYAPDDFDANMFYYLNDYEEANLNVILNYEAALGGY